MTVVTFFQFLQLFAIEPLRTETQKRSDTDSLTIDGVEHTLPQAPACVNDRRWSFVSGRCGRSQAEVQLSSGAEVRGLLLQAPSFIM